MGGRSAGNERKRPPADAWIEEVSAARLERYSRMLQGSGAGQRLDGSVRADGGEYFGDLIHREQRRRRGEWADRWNP